MCHGTLAAAEQQTSGGLHSAPVRSSELRLLRRRSVARSCGPAGTKSTILCIYGPQLPQADEAASLRVQLAEVRGRLAAGRQRVDALQAERATLQERLATAAPADTGNAANQLAEVSVPCALHCLRKTNG